MNLTSNLVQSITIRNIILIYTNSVFPLQLFSKGLLKCVLYDIHMFINIQFIFIVQLYMF